MKIIANIVALSSLFLYCYAIMSKQNSIMLLCFGLGDFVYALSYILLKDYLTSSTFILGILISFVLSYFSKKEIKIPIYLYIILEALVLISYFLLYVGPADLLVLFANLIYVFFACYKNELLFKISLLIFGILLLIYNIINLFVVGIIIEVVILLTTMIEIYKFAKTKKTL